MGVGRGIRGEELGGEQFEAVDKDQEGEALGADGEKYKDSVVDMDMKDIEANLMRHRENLTERTEEEDDAECCLDGEKEERGEPGSARERNGRPNLGRGSEGTSCSSRNGRERFNFGKLEGRTFGDVCRRTRLLRVGDETGTDSARTAKISEIR